jgi:GNAT superfamily N-acetyltransferase
MGVLAIKRRMRVEPPISIVIFGGSVLELRETERSGHSHCVAAALRHLGPPDQDAAYRFCEENPERTTYIAGWLHEGGLSRSGVVPKGWLFGEMDGPLIRGLVYVSSTGIVIPVVQSSAALGQIAEMARQNPNMVRVLVGERPQVSDLWARLEKNGMEARICRDQLGYAVGRGEFPHGEPTLGLETARPAHLDQVVSASAAMAREEAQDDPQARNPELFRSRILERLQRGRDFVHFDGGTLVFKTNVAALSPLGGQVEGIYTIPAHRNRGIGRRGTAAITTWVLERAQNAVLLVNDDNHGARRIYEVLNYRPVLESRTIFIAP